MRLRGWLAWAGVGSAVALGYRADWLASAGTAFGAAVMAAWWVCGEMLATRVRMRISAEMSEALAEAQAARTVRVLRPRLRDAISRRGGPFAARIRFSAQEPRTGGSVGRSVGSPVSDGDGTGNGMTDHDTGIATSCPS